MEQNRIPKRPSASKPRATKTPVEPAGGDAAFDHWLEGKLKSAYSSVLEEAIPEDLIRLLQQKLKD